MADNSIGAYLAALNKYASEIRVPGLDIASEPISLEHVFVEPELHAETSKISRDRGGVNAATAKQHREERSESTPKMPPREPAGRVLSSKQRVVILGEPGQGKSTLLRQYALSLTNRSTLRFLPVLVELGRKRDRTENAGEDFHWLYERLPEDAKQALGGHGWAGVCGAIQAGRASILLDGLDELAPDARLQVGELVTSLGRSRNQVVVASRPHVYRLVTLSDFESYQLLELQWNQIVALAENTCQALAREFAVEETPARRKVLEVAQGPAAPLAGNPLLLSFMCLTAIRRQSAGDLSQFPMKPVPLIGECLEALVEWHRTHKYVQTWPEDLNGAGVVKVLAPLALQTFCEGSAVIRQERVNQLRERGKRLFLGPLVSARFIERRDRDYVFPLETFREYFAARAVVSSPDPFSIVRPNLHDPEWARVILYTAGSLEKKRASHIDLICPPVSQLFVKGVDPLIRVGANFLGFAPLSKPANDALGQAAELLGTELHGPMKRWLVRSRHSTEFFLTLILRHCHGYSRALGRDLRLAAACVAGMAECPEKIAARLVDSLLDRHLSVDLWPQTPFLDSLQEAAACQQVWQRLLELTRDKHSWVREAAALALKTLASEPEVRRRLLELTRDTDASVRAEAAQALRAVACELDERERLLELMRDKDTQVRRAAERVLQTVASEPEVRQHLLALTRDNDREMRWIAARLFQTGNFHPKVWEYPPGTIPDGSVSVERAAAKAMPTVASLRDVRHRLLDLTRDTDLSVRKEAAQALWAVASDPEVRRRLLDLTRDTDASVRKEAAQALWAVASEPEVRRRLLELTRDEDSETRRIAARLLQTLAPDPEVGQYLLELTLDQDMHVRSAAAGALQTVAFEPQVRQRLLELMRDQDDPVRWVAARALQKPTSEPEVQNLLNLTRNTVPSVRRVAAHMLETRASEPEVRRRLLELTRDEEPLVRSDAAWALQTAVSESKVRQRLLELTRDKNNWVREAAALALKTLASEPEVRRRLLNLTRSWGKWLREAATSSLRNTASEPEVLRRFLKLTQDESSLVRRISAEALEKVALDPHLPRRLHRAIIRVATRFAKEDVNGLRLLEVLVEARERTQRS